jgi:D-alanine-D-alanine ligase
VIGMATTHEGAPPLKVAVLAGGRSSEHEVSLSSAAAVRDGLVSAGHEVVWVEIGRDGAWRRDGEEIAVTPGAGLLDVDVAFPVLHGPFGEDGTIQGVLEALDVPYVGAGVAASALCLDKVLFKQLMAAAAIPQVDFLGIRAGRFRSRRAEVLADVAELGLPVFVKPAHLGSSVGIVKVEDPDAVAPALEEAFEHDALVIVEAMAGGVEVECGVISLLEEQDEEHRGEGAQASEPGEIVLPGEWYDYDGGAPARAGSGAPHVPLVRVPRPRAGRLLRRRRACARQRAEHDARLHPDERLREAARGLGAALPGARRPSLSPRPGAPRASARLHVLVGRAGGARLGLI